MNQNQSIIVAATYLFVGAVGIGVAAGRQLERGSSPAAAPCAGCLERARAGAIAAELAGAEAERFGVDTDAVPHPHDPLP